jgi:hypothetical protein
MSGDRMTAIAFIDSWRTRMIVGKGDPPLDLKPA